MKPGVVEVMSATDLLLSEGVVLLGVALVFVMLFRRIGLLPETKAAWGWARCLVI